MTVSQTPKSYLKDLDKAVAEDRKNHRKKALKKKTEDKETEEELPLRKA